MYNNILICFHLMIVCMVLVVDSLVHPGMKWGSILQE